MASNGKSYTTLTKSPLSGEIETDAFPHIQDNLTEAYRMRLAGAKLKDIAKEFNIHTSTACRWLQRYEEEFRKVMEVKPAAYLLAEEAARLTDLEEQARQSVSEATSNRDKNMFLAEARKNAVARQKLYIESGVIPREPTKMYKATIDLKPSEPEPQIHVVERSREELIEELLEKLAKAPVL